MFTSFEIQRIGVVGKNVLWGVPPTETHVESSHERDSLVDDAQFLMLTKSSQVMRGLEQGFHT